MDAVNEGLKVAGVRGEDAEYRVRWRKLINILIHAKATNQPLLTFPT